MAVLIPLIGGIFVSLQGTLNGKLGKKIETIESTYLPFFLGSILWMFVALNFIFMESTIVKKTKRNMSRNQLNN